MEFDLETPFLQNSIDAQDLTSSLFSNESDHLPSQNYLKKLKDGNFEISIRRQTISLISQFSSKFDPFLSYLAVNYLDRFLSTQSEILEQAQPWMIKLLAVSCVSLASKMKKSEFSMDHFLGDDGGLIFDTQTVERMEQLMIGGLNWRMHSITPFSFTSFFISLFNLKDPPLKQALQARATEIIFKTQNDVELLELKPSMVAASALLYACHEICPMQFGCFQKAISNCSFVNKEDLFHCYTLMQEIAMNGYQLTFDKMSTSETVVNVLDHNFSTSESDKTNMSNNGPTYC